MRFIYEKKSNAHSNDRYQDDDKMKRMIRIMLMIIMLLQF